MLIFRVVFLIGIVFSGVNALACSRTTNAIAIESPTISESFSNAEIVFEGKFQSGKQIEGTFDWITTFQVSKTWKGEGSNRKMIISSHNTCNPYPYSDRKLINQVTFIANSRELDRLIFYNERSKLFLDFSTEPSARAELRMLIETRNGDKKNSSLGN